MQKDYQDKNFKCILTQIQKPINQTDEENCIHSFDKPQIQQDKNQQNSNCKTDKEISLPISTQSLYQKGFLDYNNSSDSDIEIKEITVMKKDERNIQIKNKQSQQDGQQNKPMFLICISLSKDNIFNDPHEIKIFFKNKDENTYISSQFNDLYLFNQINESIDNNKSLSKDEKKISGQQQQQQLLISTIQVVQQKEFNIMIYEQHVPIQKDVQVQLLFNQQKNKLYVQKQYSIDCNKEENQIDYLRRSVAREIFILKKLKSSNTNVTLKLIKYKEKSDENKINFNIHIKCGMKNLLDIKNQYVLNLKHEEYNTFLEYAFFQILEKLNKLHFINEIGHSDIKPSNLVLGYDLDFYIIDYGESILLDSKSDQSNYLLGATERYNFEHNYKRNKDDEQYYKWSREEIIQCDTSQLILSFLFLMCVRKDKKDLYSYEDLRKNNRTNFLKNLSKPFLRFGKYLCECLNSIYLGSQYSLNSEIFFFSDYFDNITHIFQQQRDIVFDESKGYYRIFSINSKSIQIIELILSQNQDKKCFKLMGNYTTVSENIQKNNKNNKNSTDLSDYPKFCEHFQLRKNDILYLSEKQQFKNSLDFLARIMVDENNYSNASQYSYKLILYIIKYTLAETLYFEYSDLQNNRNKDSLEINISFDVNLKCLNIKTKDILEILELLCENKFQQIIENNNIKYIIIESYQIHILNKQFKQLSLIKNKLFILHTQYEYGVALEYFDVHIIKWSDGFQKNQLFQINLLNRKKSFECILYLLELLFSKNLEIVSLEQEIKNLNFKIQQSYQSEENVYISFMEILINLRKKNLTYKKYPLQNQINMIELNPPLMRNKYLPDQLKQQDQKKQQNCIKQLRDCQYTKSEENKKEQYHNQQNKYQLDIKKIQFQNNYNEHSYSQQDKKDGILLFYEKSRNKTENDGNYFNIQIRQKNQIAVIILQSCDFKSSIFKFSFKKWLYLMTIQQQFEILQNKFKTIKNEIKHKYSSFELDFSDIQQIEDELFINFKNIFRFIQANQIIINFTKCRFLNSIDQQRAIRLQWKKCQDIQINCSNSIFENSKTLYLLLDLVCSKPYKALKKMPKTIQIDFSNCQIYNCNNFLYTIKFYWILNLKSKDFKINFNNTKFPNETQLNFKMQNCINLLNFTITSDESNANIALIHDNIKIRIKNWQIQLQDNKIAFFYLIIYLGMITSIGLLINEKIYYYCIKYQFYFEDNIFIFGIQYLGTTFNLSHKNKCFRSKIKIQEFYQKQLKQNKIFGIICLLQFFIINSIYFNDILEHLGCLYSLIIIFHFQFLSCYTDSISQFCEVVYIKNIFNNNKKINVKYITRQDIIWFLMTNIIMKIYYLFSIIFFIYLMINKYIN